METNSEEVNQKQVELVVENSNGIDNLGFEERESQRKSVVSFQFSDEEVESNSLENDRKQSQHSVTFSEIKEEDENEVESEEKRDESVEKKYEDDLIKYNKMISERKKYSFKPRSTIKQVSKATKEIILPSFKQDFKKELHEIKRESGEKKTVQEQPKKKASKRSFCTSCNKQSQFLSLTYYKNNLSIFVFILIYILLSILFLLIQLLVLYPSAQWYVKMARAGGMLLNFNSCIVILLVLRRLNTWARNTVLGAKFSVLDEFIQFHKYIGSFIFILSIIHTVGQCINAYYLSVEFDDPSLNTTDRGTYGEVLFGTASGVGWVGAGAFPTGWILLVIITIMFIFALPFIRRKGYFQLFYVTHWLNYAYYIVLIFHATHFWKWFVGPFCLVIIERIYNWFRVYSHNYGDTYIKDVNLLSSNVTHLVITRPKNFVFKSGDYMFIRIPKIARNEWHPFTISSAPELKDELWVHVRSLGNWTNKLNKYFKNFDLVLSEWYSSSLKRDVELKGIQSKRSTVRPRATRSRSTFKISSFKDTGFTNPNSKQKTDEDMKLNNNLNIANQITNANVDIHLDGPYGTASRRIFDSEHAVLFAAGIGVTPFASILQSLWFQYMRSLKTCRNCQYQWYEELEMQKTLKKVDFIWLNRDFDSFEWFIELLGEIELQQSRMSGEPFIQIHLYMTSAKEVQEIKVHDDVKLRVLNKNLVHETIADINKDFSMKLTPGRPNWQKVFEKLSSEKKGKVDAYFCGAPLLGKQIKDKCTQFKFNFSQENF